MKKIYSIGDCHGDYDRVCDLLLQSKLINENLDWIAGDSIFVSIGDITDRGKKGIDVIKLIMKLEKQAKENNGDFITLIGNHDAIFAARVYELLGQFSDYNCADLFKYNGGSVSEANIVSKNSEIFEWFINRPLIYKIDNLLFQHADTTKYYLSLGNSIEKINKIGLEMLKTGIGSWNIFYHMCDCREFDKYEFYTKREQENAILDYLTLFDVNTIIHGHTRFSGNKPQKSFDNKIINIDGSLSYAYRKDKDRGFIVEFNKKDEFYTLNDEF